MGIDSKNFAQFCEIKWSIYYEQPIMELTGHRSIEAVRGYKQTNSDVLKWVSDALQPPMKVNGESDVADTDNDSKTSRCEITVTSNGKVVHIKL